MGTTGGEHDMWHKGTRVQVAHAPRRSQAEYQAGWVGTVTSSFNDGGAMAHRVAFPDGTSATLYTDELRQAPLETATKTTGVQHG